MSWVPARRNSGKALISWLKKDEWKHIALSSKLLDAKSSPHFGTIANGRIWIKKNKDGIDGVVYISRYGVVLPAFDESDSDSETSRFLEKIIKPRENDLFSIIGMENRVLNIENHISKTSSEIINYKMLIGGGPVPSKEEEPPGLSIHRAEISDLDKLWPLEKGYQIEEVLRNPDNLNERSSRLHFQYTLKHQYVYYALLGGRLVAKAGTNARGYNFNQIGGVYVIPELRGYGFGTAIMNKLLTAIAESNHRPCLFVKKSNLPALKLYESLGFKDMGPFRISYWGE